MKTIGKLQGLLIIVCLFLVGTIPYWLSAYHLAIATQVLVFIALALAWNIVGGVGGQMSLGHSIFVGIGALLSSALLLQLGLNLWVGMLVAAAVSALFGAFIAWLDCRFHLTHLSFALITLAFAEMGQLAVLGMDFLGGASGLSLPEDKGRFLQYEFGGEIGQYYLLFVLACLCLVVNLLLRRARFGYYLRAIRDNEYAAQGIGISLLRNKVKAMALSAALTSLVGTAFARYSGFVDPYQMSSPIITVQIILFATIGGLGTVWGPVVGAGLLVPFGEIIRGKLGGLLPGLHLFLYGVVIVIVIILIPEGIVPKINKWLRIRAKARELMRNKIQEPIIHRD